MASLWSFTEFLLSQWHVNEFRDYIDYLPSFTEFYRVLPSFTEFYLVLPSFKKYLVWKKVIFLKKRARWRAAGTFLFLFSMRFQWEFSFFFKFHLIHFFAVFIETNLLLFLFLRVFFSQRIDERRGAVKGVRWFERISKKNEVKKKKKKKKRWSKGSRFRAFHWLACVTRFGHLFRSDRYL